MKLFKSPMGVAGVLTIILTSGCATSPTGRKQLILLPDSQMSMLGTQAFDVLKSQTPAETDPQLEAYVKCIVGPLLAGSESKLPAQKWEVVVFKDPSANAFALPGGKIGVHSGLLPVAKTDAQLAAVIGHEIGHVIAKHGAERMSQGLVAQLGSSALSQGLRNNPSAGLIMAAVGVGTQVGAILPFSRKHESEADLIGLDLMSRAGFDPRQSVDLWKNMMSASGGKGPPQWLSTHPTGDTRIRALEENMPAALVKYQQAIAAGPQPTCSRPQTPLASGGLSQGSR